MALKHHKAVTETIVSGAKHIPPCSTKHIKQKWMKTEYQELTAFRREGSVDQVKTFMCQRLIRMKVQQNGRRIDPLSAVVPNWVTEPVET